MTRAKKSSAPLAGTKGETRTASGVAQEALEHRPIRSEVAGNPLPSGSGVLPPVAVAGSPAEDYPAHVHEPIPHAPYIVYVPVQRQRFYTCATCGIPLFVIPTPEEADEYDRVLESQFEERG